MIIDAETFSGSAEIQADVTIIGAGPAGITIALELARSGHDVVLVESGRLKFDNKIQELGKTDYIDPEYHATMSESTRRQIGGASIIWGGRCVPYDPIDFDERKFIPFSKWPVTYEDISSYFQRACDYSDIGMSEFNINELVNIKNKTIIPNLPDGNILTSDLERWSLPTNFGKQYLSEIKQLNSLRLIYGLTCTEIISTESLSSVDRIVAKTLSKRTIILKSKKKYSFLWGIGNNTITTKFG